MDEAPAGFDLEDLCVDDETCHARHNRDVRKCRAAMGQQCGKLMTLAEYRNHRKEQEKAIAELSKRDDNSAKQPDDTWSIVIVVIVLLLAVVVTPVATLLFMRARTRRAREALDDAPGPTEECVACGSPNTTRPEPDLLLCLACGYEGGAGVARRQEARKRDALQAVDAAVLVRQAADDLRTAAEELTTALEPAGWFKTSRLSLDTTEYIAASGGGRSGERQQWEYKLDALFKHTYQTQKYLRDAARKIDVLVHRGDAPADLNLGAWELSRRTETFAKTFEGLGRAREVLPLLEQFARVIERHRALLPPPE